MLVRGEPQRAGHVAQCGQVQGVVAVGVILPAAADGAQHPAHHPDLRLMLPPLPRAHDLFRHPDLLGQFRLCQAEGPAPGCDIRTNVLHPHPFIMPKR